MVVAHHYRVRSYHFGRPWWGALVHFPALATPFWTFLNIFRRVFVCLILISTSFLVGATTPPQRSLYPVSPLHLRRTLQDLHFGKGYSLGFVSIIIITHVISPHYIAVVYKFRRNWNRNPSSRSLCQFLVFFRRLHNKPSLLRYIGITVEEIVCIVYWGSGQDFVSLQA